MVQVLDPRHPVSLDDYERIAHLGPAVHELRQEAKSVLPVLEGRRIWMVNSARRGGGVAELLPPFLTLLRELGVNAAWLGMEPEDAAFFRLTKHLHNLVHGCGDPGLGPAEREHYDRVSREAAKEISGHLRPRDVLVIHDPQPLGAGAILRDTMDIAAIWRCHIGLDRNTPETRAAWAFLDDYVTAYDHAVFSAPEYIPDCLTGRVTIIHPAIDPLSHKNRDLSIHELIGILGNGTLIRTPGPMQIPAFSEPAKRLQADASWRPATEGEDIGLLYRPVVTQISRWDRLKGFSQLLEGFVALKRDCAGMAGLVEQHRRILQLARLVLAGPAPGAIEDDPEGQEVLAELREVYASLPPEIQRDVAIILLPMSSHVQNALLVNALQRCSDIVAQTSLQEGFGLTATEAMWKGAAVVASDAAGLRQQIRPELDGCLLSDPHDPHEIAEALHRLLCDPSRRQVLGRSAQQRVYRDFLVFPQIRRWLGLIAETVRTRWPAAGTLPRAAGIRHPLH